MNNKQAIIDLTNARPAAVLVIDLVKHSSRSTFEIRRIQKILEDVFSETSKLLNIEEVQNKYTGDGYVCTFLGDASARIIDFLNVAVPELKQRFTANDQAFRIGVDFGLLRLRSNDLTKGFEHFDQVGIQAARLENAAKPNQILCTNTVFQVFGSHYPEVFANEPIAITTKDRIIDAFEICPLDCAEIQQAFSDYIYGTVSEVTQTELEGFRNQILIVDDEPAIRALIQQHIASAFPKVKTLTATNGVEALELFKSGLFAVVITDVIMPCGIDGLELTERLLSIDKNLVVIMMSGYSWGPAIRFYEAGGFRFFSKPFDIHQLQQTLKLALNGHLPRLFRNLHVICEKPGVLILELQQISDAIHFVFDHAKREGHIAQSLIRHKVKHIIADFVKTVRPGNDVITGAELVRVQMECLSRLALVTSKAADAAFPLFLQRYVDDLRKQHMGVELTLNIEATTMAALANNKVETILGLVVCELIDNAIGAISGRGRVIVDVAVLTSMQQLKLTVQDSGRGVLSENLSLVFSQGFSTKGSGRGLGLHLVREAVQRLGGRISYQTIDGACFTVVVPIEIAN